MWDRICATRYGVTDPKLRRFRYGVQVNSLGLTEAQPENNIAAHRARDARRHARRDARARSIQLPAWNEALGLPRPWDQQWSLRIQQVLALETDLLEYDDIFAGSHVIEARTDELEEAAQAELDDVLALGGAFEAIDEIKGRLVRSQTERTRRIESGELQVVGVNCFTETAPSPLGGDEIILKVDPAVEAEVRDDVDQWRKDRDQRARSTRRSTGCGASAETDENLMPATIALAHAGGTTGEWGARAARGVRRVPRPDGCGGGRGRTRRRAGRPGGAQPGAGRRPAAAARRQARPRRALQRRRADRGGGRATRGWRSSTRASASRPSRSRWRRATRTSTSSASRSSRAATSSWSPRSCACSGRPGVDAPVVVGGIIPADDRPKLESLGVAAVYTPKDFELTRIMADISALAAARRAG